MNRAILTLLSVLFVAGCGGGGAKPDPANTTNGQQNPCAATSAAATGATGDTQSPDGRITTIKQLAKSIDDKMKKLSVRDDTGEPLDASCASIEVPDHCSDVCPVATDICNSSKRICTLADELSGNTWAAEQCKAGKNSCRRAEIHCCECKQAG